MSEQRYRISRRGFIAGAAGAAASASLLSNLPASVAEAAQGRKGSLDRIEHVVILMQENRSFDHYFGTMRGVRGFGDRAALRLHTNQDVFHQPDATRADGGFLLPWRVDTSKVDGQDMDGTPHDWNSTHLAWNGGLWNLWPPAKSELTMAYFGATDIPFQRALAQAFTVCDNYFCSIQGPTTPNRLYLWTGTIDPEGHNGGPCAANPDDYLPIFTWKTYPERLQASGISWQVYANDEVGDGDFPNDAYVGDFGDNPLWFFHAYHDALASKDPKVHQLAERASVHDGWKPNSGQGKDTKHVLSQFIADCQADTLPAVSWVVAPYAYTEHPVARPVDGAAYVQTMLNALWSNPNLAGSTVVLIDYDENDGFYDHVPPPAAPPGTPNEMLPAIQPGFRGLPPASGPLVPIGLGPRVPMTVISPWSHGGWVNSQVFDHTSVLRFLEVWTGVHEPNISAWRRALCGDLTSCFDFAAPRFIMPMLPDTTALRHQADQTESGLPKPTPPLPGQQTVPVQDAGSAPARALPYQALADLELSGGQLVAHMSNHGTATLQLSLYAHHALSDAAQRFDLNAGGSATASVAPEPISGAYDVWIHGPNGFVRHASGTALGPEAGIEAAVGLDDDRDTPRLRLTLRNHTAHTQTVRVTGLHNLAHTFMLTPHDVHVVALDPLAKNHGWYDLVVSVEAHPLYTRRFAGHLENGRPSRTTPD
jgi:phospholipase C